MSYNIVQTNATVFSGYNLELRPVSGGSTNEQIYRLYVVNNNWFYVVNSANSTDYDIKHNTSTNVWSDVGSGHPAKFAASSSTSTPSSNSITATTSSTNKYLHLYNPSTETLGYIDLTSFYSNSGGGGTGTQAVGWGGSFYNVTSSNFSYKVYHTSAFTSPQTYELHSTTLTPTFISDLVVGAASGSINSRTHTWGTPDVVQIRDAYGTVAAELTLSHSTSLKKVFCNFW